MDMQKADFTLSGQPQANLAHTNEQPRPAALPYEAPYMVSYTDQDILEELGPALTGLGSDNGLNP